MEVCPAEAIDFAEKACGEWFISETRLEVAQKVPYDEAVTTAQLERKSLVETADGPAARKVRRTWTRIDRALKETEPNDGDEAS